MWELDHHTRGACESAECRLSRLEHQYTAAHFAKDNDWLQSDNHRREETAPPSRAKHSAAGGLKLGGHLSVSSIVQHPDGGVHLAFPL